MMTGAIEHEERLRRAARILDGLTQDEQAAWSDQLDALARGDYKAAGAALARIQQLAAEAEVAGRRSDVDHLALMSLVHDRLAS
jgi:hypothetical protein